MTMSTNLGWPSEPEPGPEHRRLGWLARRLGVSRGMPAIRSSGDLGGQPTQPGSEDERPEPSTGAQEAGADAAPIASAVTGKHEETDTDRAAGAAEALVGEDPRPWGGPADEWRYPAEDAQVLEAAGAGAGAPRDGSPAVTTLMVAPEPVPVDRPVDDSAPEAPIERDDVADWLGDNSVDDDLRRREFDAGHEDREAIVAALPPVDDETPLARELAENARRRIQLTGRPFPKPLAPRVLTVANQKGGVGKTTTAVNVAAALAQSGLTVLVVDLDPQGNASTALGIDHHAEVPSIYDVLVDGTPLLDVVQPCTTVGNLHCAPATIDLAGAEIELVSLVARESRLQKAIVAATEAGHSFDYILIDCPPSLGLLTVNAMVAASEVFIPIQCEYYALEGLSQLLKNIELVKAHLNPTLHVSTILLTMYDGRTRLSAQVADEVREHFPGEVLRTTVPRSVRVSEAPSFGETVMTYDPTSSGALAYLEAAGELADRGAAGRV